MRKVLFVVQNMNMGGVQKAFINTLNAMSNQDYEIDVFSFASGVLENELPENVNFNVGNYFLRLLLTPLDEVKKGNLISLIIRCFLVAFAKLTSTKKVYYFLFRFEKMYKEYDIAVSYFNDVFTGVSNKGSNWFVSDFVTAGKKIAWIHTDPEKAKFDIAECRRSYEKFDVIACVSAAIKAKIDTLLPEYKEKTQVIYNYFPQNQITRLSEETVEGFENELFNIVTVGRVENGSKRMDRIVRICEALKAKGIKWFRWRIVGDGPDLEKLKALSEKLNTSDVLEFVGQKVNPYPFIKKSQLLVLTSDYEGYPMVIGEALVLGVPVITTDFAAAREMITDFENGFVCTKEEKVITEKLELMIRDRDLYSKLKNQVCTNSYVNKYWNEQLKEVFR